MVGLVAPTGRVFRTGPRAHAPHTWAAECKQDENNFTSRNVLICVSCIKFPSQKGKCILPYMRDHSRDYEFTVLFVLLSLRFIQVSNVKDYKVTLIIHV